MTNIEIRTRDIYENLTPVEQKVAAFFLTDVNSVFHMPIARLAEVSGASQVAWVRFSKSLGFYGLKDLKKELFSELNRAADSQQGSEEPLYADISGNNTVGQMAETVCAGSIQAIEETLHLADVLFAPEQTSKYELVEGLVVYFLYFEFIALIVKYFQSGFHFPLRYFVYIGITAIVRLIIVDHKAPMDVLIYSAAILLLVITLWLCNSKRLKRE